MSKVNRIFLKPEDAPIQRVVIYSDFSEIKRSLKVPLNAGRNEVCVQNLTLTSLKEDSVRVDGKELGISQEVRFEDSIGATSGAPNTEIERVLKSKKRVIAELNDQLDRIQKRKINLEKILDESVHSTEEKEPVFMKKEFQSRVEDLDNFFEKQMASLQLVERDAKEKLETTTEEVAKLELRPEIQQRILSGNASKTAVITVECGKSKEVELDLSYIVYNAMWRPVYDVRVVSGDDSKMKINYFGNVTQFTGEDWNNVDLVLSTSILNYNAEIPDLGTIEASIARPQVVQPFQGRQGNRRFRPRNNNAQGGHELGGNTFSVPAPTYAQTPSADFVILGKATVAANNQTHRVAIGTIEVPMHLLHECVPARSQFVYLTALSKNTSDFLLFAGDASVFVNNALVAKTTIDHTAPNERFTCSLGVDSTIRVDYRPPKTYSERIGVLSSTQSVATERAIHITNNKSKQILLKLQENIPRSSDETIKVNVASPTITEYVNPVEAGEQDLPPPGAKLNNRHNLEWVVELAAGEHKELQLKYVLHHPEDARINLFTKY